MQLQDFAQVVCSKNAGPLRFTLDVIFRSDADYQRAAQSEALTAEKIAPLYGVPASAVKVINYPLGRAIKIVIHGGSCRAIRGIATAMACSSTRHYWTSKYERILPRSRQLRQVERPDAYSRASLRKSARGAR